MSEEKKLTNRQEAFVAKYLGEAKFNATKAAILAGYSEKTAGSIGHALLKNVEIRARIADELEAGGVSAHRTISELADVAYSDWRDHVQIVYDNEGNEKDAIIVLRDKVRSLELLGKIQGLMVDRSEVKATVSVDKVYAGFDPEKV